MQFFPNLLAKAGGNSFTRTTLPLDEPVGRHLSMVVAAIPANAAFPLHMHPKSEDAFVVISGSGHLMGSESTRSISGLDAVWIPPGNAHGLTTGHEGLRRSVAKFPRTTCRSRFPRVSIRRHLVRPLLRPSSRASASPANHHGRPFFRHRMSKRFSSSQRL